MTCAAFGDDGAVSECFLTLCSAVVSGGILPFLWTRIRKQEPSKPRLRSIVGWLVAAFCLAQNLAIASLLTVAASVSTIYLLARLTPKSKFVPGEILWFWLFQAVIAFVRLAEPSAGIRQIVGALAAAATLFKCYTYIPRGSSAFENSNIFQVLSVEYLTNLLRVAKHRQLDRGDLPARPLYLTSVNACQKLIESLHKFRVDGKYRIFWALLTSLRYHIVSILGLNIVANLVTYLRPLVLAKFLASLQSYSDGGTLTATVTFAGMLAATQLCELALRSLGLLVSNIAFTTSRASLMGVIYRKSLNLSSAARETNEPAKIMNLLNVDTAMIEAVYANISTLISAPLGLLICIWQLYHFLGISTVAAVPIYLLFIPYSGWHTRKMYRRFPETMAAKDKRTKATWGIFRNIKSLKLYAWEAPYFDRVAEARQNELAIVSKYRWLNSLMSSISIMLDDFVATAIFLAYLYYTRKALTPQIVFPVLSLLASLSEPLLALPRAVTSLGRALTAQHRINDFLGQPEQDHSNYERLEVVPHNDFETPVVAIKDMTCTWGDAEGSVALEGINLELKRGELCCILGRVGQGKTALLRAICSQMTITTGSIAVAGRIAYCSQEPWLQFKTIRENILFGLEYEPEVYDRVLSACELLRDLSSLPRGDMTEIGEKGIVLSGGQKARVALARAVYNRADVYVLDDILSAVDEHVSRKLIDSILAPGGLLANKTIILGTNNLKVLSYASQVMILADKSTEYCGAPNSLDNLPELLSKVSDQPVESFSFQDRKNVLKPPKELKPPRTAQAMYIPNRKEEKDNDVDFSAVFGRYFASAGKVIAILAIALLFLSVLSKNLIMVWLTIWSDKNLSGIKASEFYILVYLSLSVVTGLAVFFSIYWFNGTMAIKASTGLHNSMLASTIRAPLLFFETTPLGTIMNRFTGDVDKIDNSLPDALYSFSRSLTNIVVSFAIMIVGAPFVLIILIPLLMLYNSYRALYFPGSRQLQRMGAASRSPILSHIEESIKGVHTIKSFDQVDQFISVYELRSDYWMHVLFSRSSLRRWLNWRISWMTAVMTLASALCVTAIVSFTSWQVGLAGIVLHSTQRGGMMLSRIIQGWTNVEMSSVAIERVLSYIDLEPEAREFGPIDPPDHWPGSGEVEMKNYSTRYRPELPLALKSVNLKLRSKEKIGVVGRTGSGKSTLTLALFRILEAAEGSIEVDSLNIRQVGLHDVRKRLSIIPQDAQIFAGSLRMNLDPIGQATDQWLWEILELCHLKDHFAGSPGGLDTILSEGGENLSRGQAQLICLGRALLHDSHVLLLDEATASVDVATDQLVQSTIRNVFEDRTIITIAHRIDTIKDSDRIVVMDNGTVAEIGTPDELTAKKGAFYSLLNAPTDK